MLNSFDLDLPLEVDDYYWDSTQKEPFKQPPGIPSFITAFNELIKLTQIMAFALKTLVCSLTRLVTTNTTTSFSTHILLV